MINERIMRVKRMQPYSDRLIILRPKLHILLDEHFVVMWRLSETDCKRLYVWNLGTITVKVIVFLRPLVKLNLTKDITPKFRNCEVITMGLKDINVKFSIHTYIISRFVSFLENKTSDAHQLSNLYA